MINPLGVRFFSFVSFTILFFKYAAGGAIDSRCVCGKPGAISSRIVGGRITKPNEYPWMAAIFYEGKMICGGSLINEKYVVTAGHCLIGSQKSKLSVILGMHDRVLMEKEQIGGVKFDIDKVILHEDFESFDIYDTNDIGLLKLKKRVVYDDDMSPVCLPTDSDNTYVKKRVTVTGWGRTGEEDSPSRFLQEADLKVISNSNCKKFNIFNSRVRDTMLCTFRRNVDACQGDSGGPLVFETSTGKVEQIGIVSWGIGCARAGTPGVFTRMTSYLDWIAENTKDAKYCKIPP